MATTRMTNRAGFSYRYDRAGNLDSVTAGSPAWKYVYDALDRLVEVRQNGTLIARYAYDVLGRRIVKRVYTGADSGYVRMIYRGGEVIAEADFNGTLTFGYTRGLETDNLLAIRRYSDSSDYYVIHDPLGSVRGLSKRDGTWIASWRYDVYGTVIDSAGSSLLPVRYRWTGREYDAETGLYFFRSRFYDPAVQRFVQEDPIGFAGGPNLYAYGDGNPTNGRDPDGMDKSELFYSWERTRARDQAMSEWSSGRSTCYIDGVEVGNCAMLLGAAPGWLVRVPVGFLPGVFAANAARAASANSMACLGNAGCVVDRSFLDDAYNEVSNAASAEASWPTWRGLVGHWDAKNPTPQLTLIGGGTHGASGVWTMRHRGQTDKWPQDWMPNPTDWGVNLGTTVEFYRGYYQDASFTIRMEAFGIVWPVSGRGWFVAKPSTSCKCSGLPLYDGLWP